MEPEYTDIEAWRRECPMDYLKAIGLLRQYPDPLKRDVAFRAIFNVCKAQVPDTLYKYYSLAEDDGAGSDMNSRKLATLEGKKVYTSLPSGMNDPFDCRGYFYDPSKMLDIPELVPYGGKFLDALDEPVRLSSFTAAGPSLMPMWAHYSNNHRGYCVAYEMRAPENADLLGCTFPVQYTVERLDITWLMHDQAEAMMRTVREVNAHGGPFVINDLMLVYAVSLLANIKNEAWSYEREFRCTIASQGGGGPYVDAAPSAIYVGSGCSDDNSAELVRIARKLGVPAYRMQLDPLSVKYELEPVPLG